MPGAGRSTALERQIASQPEELRRLLDEPLATPAVRTLRGAARIWLVGTGTSLHAAIDDGSDANRMAFRWEPCAP